MSLLTAGLLMCNNLMKINSTYLKEKENRVRTTNGNHAHESNTAKHNMGVPILKMSKF